MAEWFDKLSPQQQHLYIYKHPKTKLKPSNNIEPINISDKDFETKVLPVASSSKEVFKSVDNYKDKILSMGKLTLSTYADKIKQSLEKDPETQKSVAGDLLNKIGLLTIGAGSLALMGSSAIILIPLLLENKDLIRKIAKSNPAQIVLDFMEGIFQGVREGLDDHNRLKKAIIYDDSPPQVFIGKKPETSSVGNLSNPSDVVKSFTKLNTSLDNILSQSELIGKNKLVARAINLQTEVASVSRKLNMLFANNTNIDINSANRKLDIIHSNLKSCIEIVTILPKKDLIEPKLIEYSYESHIQEETPQCFSFIKKATISKLKNSDFYIAIESASDTEVVASISDVKSQLPYMFKSYKIDEFKNKVRKILQ